MNRDAVDWFQRLPARVADPVLEARLVDAAPELPTTERRSLVFDLVTGSRSLGEALAEAVSAERRPRLASALAPAPFLEEAVAVLERLGREEEARALEATGELAPAEPTAPIPEQGGPTTEEDDAEPPPPELLLPPPIGTTDLPSQGLGSAPDKDLAQLERAVERLDTKLEGLRTQLVVFTTLAAAALAAWAGYALGRS